jgi:hypothetical protein
MIRTLTKRLYLNSKSFSTVINSVPGDRPPLREENVEGRYAGVLFTVASRNQELESVNTDMTMISQALKQVGVFYPEREVPQLRHQLLEHQVRV